MASNEAGRKWYWAALGTILLTIVSDSIAEKTKEIPILNNVVFFFRWLYRKVAKFLNLEVKMWVIIVFFLLAYLIWSWSKRLAKYSAPPPAFYNYTSDRFHNWTWKWNWQKLPEGWKIKDLAPYCTQCDVELGMNTFAGTARCPSCHTEYGYYGTSQPFEPISDAERLVRAKANKMIHR
jgi:hypothetical protein